MRRVFEHKLFTISIIILLSATPYAFFVNKLSVYIWPALIMTICFYYCVYVLNFIFQYVMLSLLGQQPNKYLILYPFTYDGTISFVPLKLLYHSDLLNSNFYLNLVNDLGGKLKDKFCKMYLIKNITTLLSIVIVFLFIYQNIYLIVVGFIFSSLFY